MATRPSLDEIFASQDTSSRPSLDEIFNEPAAPKKSNYPAAVAYGIDKSNPLGFVDIIDRWMKTQHADIPEGANPITYVKPKEPDKFTPTTTGEKITAGASEAIPAIGQAVATGGLAGGLAKGPGMTKFLLQALGAAAPGASRGAERGFNEGGAVKAVEKGGEAAATDLAVSVGTLGAGKLLAPAARAVKAEVLGLIHKMGGQTEKQLTAVIKAALNRTPEGRILIKEAGEDNAYKAVRATLNSELPAPTKIGGKEIEKVFENPGLRKMTEGMKLKKGLPGIVREADQKLYAQPGKLAGSNAAVESLKKDFEATLSNIHDAGYKYSDIADLRRSYANMAAKESDPIKKQFFDVMIEGLNARLSPAGLSGKTGRVLKANQGINVIEQQLGPALKTEQAYRAGTGKAAEEAVRNKALWRKWLIGALGTLGVGTVGTLGGKAIIEGMTATK